jgi:hypothetical protein
MLYSKRKFGAELVLQLESGYDIEKISHWATQLYQNHSFEMQSDLIEAIQIIASMSFGLEFEKTEQDLRNLAINLIETDLHKLDNNYHNK